MRDNMKPCQHTLSDDIVYKDVVVIGNGPSGMVTSFMLAGNVPYLKELPEDLPIDEMLRARLTNLTPGQNLYETDLLELAEGLEGRSQNPIPLLTDNLLRPCADLGVQADSLIEWRYDVEKEIDHVVLGRGPPGGAWPTFPPHVRTLSPGTWLWLPPLPANAPERLSARAVAAYCRRYVLACGLQRYFRSNAVVLSVSSAGRAGGAPCGPACPRGGNFWVSGYDKSEGRGFRYLCRRVVVACGACDRPNLLPARVSAHATHSLASVERAAHLLADAPLPPSQRAVLVVGSGVSAADAVRLCRAARVPVHHLHREPAPSLAKLSPIPYPDYCQVYKMMCDGPSGNHPNYTPYPQHIIIEVTPLPPQDCPLKATEEVEDNTIRLKRVKLLDLVTNQTIELTVTLIAVLIGSKPDLFFLQTNFDLNTMDIKKCKCNEKKIEEQKQCFLRNHWHYLKSVVGQSIQSCKSRYLNYTEINGNMDTKCALPDCNKRDTCACDTKAENGLAVRECKCEIIPYSNSKRETNCQCQPTNPYSHGLGYGLDPKKPVDGRSNPVAIDKSTHEILNAPKGMYALGPLTADNFIRFIPGGALAIVSHIHREMKTE